MKNKILFYLTVIMFFYHSNTVSAQESANPYKDSIVQLFGVVMTADSLRGIPSASVIVEGRGRGTITNYDGVFSIAVMKGDKITFSSIGFKNNTIHIPANLKENQYSVIQLLISDTSYLPATILKPRPTREQFERDFVNNRMPDDAYEIARKNTSPEMLSVIMKTLPSDGREAMNYQIRQQTNKYYYAGQLPPMNVLNPAAWADFINAWKRGDFKRKK